MAVRKCKLCKKPFEGRTDKIFCGQSCKAVYHQKLKKATNLVADPIDTILHRNRSTLLEIMGKSASQKKSPPHPARCQKNLTGNTSLPITSTVGKKWFTMSMISPG
ncbi:MAG: hypothetical protein UZ08_BCD001000094 [Candidatus Parvibacillus calidus]|nr:MAG: hypothetical protein UZ08_BCD001000094 [Candidatus Parvibacillus calidus]